MIDSNYSDSQVRKAVECDAEAIANVHVSAWRYAYSGLLPESVIHAQSISDRAAFWTKFIADPDTWPVFVLEGNGIEGFASVIPARDDGLDTLAVSELAAIYLSERSSGKKLGNLLLSRCLEVARLRDRTSMILWVLEENHRAIKFYKTHGFSADGESIYEERLQANEIRMRVEF